MKPYTLVAFIASLTKENTQQVKLPMYLARAKTALANLRALGWSDEEIKGLVVKLTAPSAKTLKKLAYILGVLNNYTYTPNVISVSDTDEGNYDDWVKKEIARIKNAEPDR